METNNFIVTYNILFKDGSKTNNTTRVKNCMSSLHAKIKLEEYVKRKNASVDRIVVISCGEDVLDNLMNIFGMK